MKNNLDQLTSSAKAVFHALMRMLSWSVLFSTTNTRFIEGLGFISSNISSGISRVEIWCLAV